MPINANINYQQVLSMALEDRSRGWQDIVSKNSPLYDLLNRKGYWESYSGPRIRQRLMFSLPEIQFYRDYDFLRNEPEEAFNDAYWTPKQAAVPISLSMTEILNNRGSNQLLPVLRSYIERAEKGLAQGLDTALYGDGTGDGGKAIDGLGAAIPEVPTNVYGGINRATETLWRTGAYNMASNPGGFGTTITSTNVKDVFDYVMGQHTRGNESPDVILTCAPHWNAYNQSLMAIQRINDSNGTGASGFRRLQYVGPGQVAEVVWGGGIRNSMPTNTSFFINSDTLRMRYNPDRNFDNLFPGEGARPINQDAIAQFVGWMGNLTMTNGNFNARLFGG